ncbi:hypothetical protein GGS24DRAFT_516852 [Hypoxylon argillaceum]|nr:hypothetical protein GGS24DRAFT_516852 [Hypoxylon argillaceum]
MWRPLYLRIHVLATFNITFIVLIAVLEYLLVVSNRGKGLATVEERFQYACMYGPTAVSTITALAWARVKFQIQTLAPWNRMKKSATRANDSLLLDYLNMLPPVAVLQALKRRDWAPAAASSISLVLQVVVTLSTSLIRPHMTQIESSVPLTLKTRFYNSSSDLVLDMELPYLTMTGMPALLISYPEGTTARYAYQTLTNSPEVGTSLSFEVDGFSADLDCTSTELKVLETSPYGS